MYSNNWHYNKHCYLFRFLLAFFFSALSTICYATSLLEVFSSATENDPQWMADQALSAAEIAQNEAGISGLLPDVSVQASWMDEKLENEYIGGSKKFNADSQSVVLTQPLFRLDKWNEFQRSKKNQSASAANLQVKRAEFIQRVTQVYFDMLKAYVQKYVAQANVDDITLQRQAQELREELGITTAIDVSQIKALEKQVLANRSLAESNATLQLDRLMQVTGLLLIVVEPLKDVMLDSLTLEPIEHLKLHLYQQNAQLQTMRYQIDSAKYDVKQAKSLFAPQVDFVMQYGNSDSLQFLPSGQQAVVETTQTAYGINLNWPIFQGGQKYFNIKASQLKVDALDAQYQQLMYELENNLLTLWYQFKQTKTLIESKKYAVDFARQKLDRAVLSEQLGEMSRLDVASAKAQLLVDQQALLIEKLNLVMQWLNIKLLLAEVTPETINFIDQQLVFAGQSSDKLN